MQDAAPTSFNILTAFLGADLVVKAVMLGLAAASLWSWTIILDKAFRFAALNRDADRFEAEVGSGRSLEEVATMAGDQPKRPLPRMLQAALREWRDGRRGGALSDGQAALVIARVDRALDSVMARETRRIEDGLGSLAIVATASPFVGLFGTVWGIMRAFGAIGAQKSTSLAVVAPPIAEALFATAIGLAAAIPAYIAYNKFSTDAAKFAGRLEAFADDLAGAVARRLGGSGGPGAGA
jgi:biopolymer transport protein TolQ